MNKRWEEFLAIRRTPIYCCCCQRILKANIENNRANVTDQENWYITYSTLIKIRTIETIIGASENNNWKKSVLWKKEININIESTGHVGEKFKKTKNFFANPVVVKIRDINLYNIISQWIIFFTNVKFLFFYNKRNFYM